MIGIAIPAHNEEHWLEACLNAALLAARHPDLMGEEVCIVVVMDDCSDRSQAIARAYPVTTLEIRARNVGVARAAGASHLLNAGARWLAFTDADTEVSSAWLTMQLSLGADAVCGSVGVKDWSAHAQHMDVVRARFADHYQDAEGHRHIHGANFGVSARAYRRAGGFPPLSCSEDVALVKALIHSGASIAWSAAPRVATSARTNARARGGFGDNLLTMLGEAAQHLESGPADMPQAT